MLERDSLPGIGFVSWFVGAGDSFTLFTGKEGRSGELVLQVDLNHLEVSEDDYEPQVAVIDQLAEILPEANGKPYLAAFALTHPDLDHCRGFGDLIKKVAVGELWVTPRIFEEYKTEFSDDAEAFRKEADRRLKIAIKGGAKSGDRIRVIGHKDVLGSEPYSDLPDSAKSEIGTAVESIDGHDIVGRFAVVFCGPAEADDDADRNDTSLAMQVTLTDGHCSQHFLLLGDLTHEALGNLFENADSSHVEFDVVVVPHHCSKGALFDSDGKADKKVVEGLKTAKAKEGWAVASSPPIPNSDRKNADPPHRVAWDEYAKIFGADHIVCTGSHGSKKDPDPVLFAVGDPCGYLRPEAEDTAASTDLGRDVERARPRPKPSKHSGYGRR